MIYKRVISLNNLPYCLTFCKLVMWGTKPIFNMRYVVKESTTSFLISKTIILIPLPILLVSMETETVTGQDVVRQKIYEGH